MDHEWAKVGPNLGLSRNPTGSLLDHLWIMEPSWIPRGSLRDHLRVKLRPILEPLGSLADPSGIIEGSKLDPTWNQLGSFSIHHGSWWVRFDLNWNRFVPSRVPQGSRQGQKLDPNWNRALSEPNGSSRIHIGTVAGHQFAL